MWLYRGPLVCFWIVEFHYPDRVLRQFGYPPLIPGVPDVPRSEIRDYHHWVLRMVGWHAYRDEHGRPFLPPGPAYMPPPPEHHESPEIQSEEDESLTFSFADFAPADQWDTAASPPLRQPYPPRAHDCEASGSGTQPDYASQLADSLFHTPLPPLATYAAEPTDPWSVALTMSARAEPVEQVTPALRAQDGELQWAPWRERNFSRENKGRPPRRFSHSDFD
ncbi:uncharacterized protein LOC144568685 [Carex rostrata]